MHLLGIRLNSLYVFIYVTNFVRVEIMLIINNVFSRVVFLVQMGFILCIRASYDTQ